MAGFRMNLSVFLFFSFLSASQAGVGRYELRVVEVNHCPEVGTNEVKFTTRLSKKDTHTLVYSTNWTWPYDLDDHFGVKVEAAQWGSGGWGLNSFNAEKKNYCKTFKSMLPKLHESFFTSMGISNPTCPIKAGTYLLNEWDLNFTDKIRFILLQYGKFRVRMSYLHDGKIIGCQEFIIEITPASKGSGSLLG